MARWLLAVKRLGANHQTMKQLIAPYLVAAATAAGSGTVAAAAANALGVVHAKESERNAWPEQQAVDAEQKMLDRRAL